MKFLIILGIGNSIRMDDGAGIKVVELLEQDKDLKKYNISFKYLNTGGLDILDVINGYSHAIIVDAASMADQGYMPGDFYYLENLNDLKNEYLGEISSHGVGVFSFLKYAKIGGYSVPDPIEVYGIQIKETGFFSEELTPEIAKAVDKLVDILKNKIRHFFST